MNTWRCPKCKIATSFHVKEEGNKIYLTCWYGINSKAHKPCCWKSEIMLVKE